MKRAALLDERVADRASPSDRHPAPGVIVRMVCLAFLLMAAGALAAEGPPAKRVLMLFSEGKDLPTNVMIERAAKAELAAHSTNRIEFYAEHLDASHFPGESYYKLFREYLREKYSSRPPDLIMAFLARGFGLAGELPADVFPEVPVVIVSVNESEIPDRFRLPRSTGIVQRHDFKGTFELVLTVQPDTRRIVVIGGVAPIDQIFIQRAKEVAQALSARVKFEFWTNRPVADLCAAVATLPTDTVVCLSTVLRDAAGQNYFPEQVAESLAPAASVPVYVLSESLFGTGAVGGALVDFDGLGRRAGELGLRILSGTPAAELPVEVRSNNPAIFDWRALKRWGVSEQRLPTGSVVRFRPPSLWEDHKGLILAITTVVLVQMLTIAALLVHRARRQRSEKALSESETRMNLAAEAANLGLWAWDVGRDEIWATVKCRALFGFTPEQRVSFAQFAARVHPDDRPGMEKAVVQALEKKAPFDTEYRVRLPGGGTRWISARGVAVGSGTGTATRMLGVCIDVTGRKQAEERFRLAVEASSNGILLVDKAGRIVLVNSQTEQLFGYRREELIGQVVELLVPQRYQALHPGQRHGLMAGPTTRVMGKGRELFGRRKDGSEVPVEIGLASINTLEGRFVLATIVDITERKRAEQELAQQRSELGHLSRVSILGEISGSLAHELNQPLGAILANAQAARRWLAGDHPNLPETRAAIEDIIRDDKRAGEIVHRVRALAKKDAPEKQLLDVNQVTRETAALLRSELVATDVPLTLELRPDLPSVKAGYVELQQSLLNLMLNGLQAQEATERTRRGLTVSTRHAGGMVIIAVRDCGPGLSPEIAARVFDAFFTTKPGGMGLGLAFCRRIAETHGGRLWEENHPDGGAVFSLSLPANTPRA